MFLSFSFFGSLFPTCLFPCCSLFRFLWFLGVFSFCVCVFLSFSFAFFRHAKKEEHHRTLGETSKTLQKIINFHHVSRLFSKFPVLFIVFPFSFLDLYVSIVRFLIFIIFRFRLSVTVACVSAFCFLLFAFSAASIKIACICFAC